jgi:hypothetical protein
MSTPAPPFEQRHLDLISDAFIRQQDLIVELSRQQTYTSWAILLLFGLLIVLCLGLYIDDRRKRRRAGE